MKRIFFPTLVILLLVMVAHAGQVTKQAAKDIAPHDAVQPVVAFFTESQVAAMISNYSGAYQDALKKAKEEWTLSKEEEQRYRDAENFWRTLSWLLLTCLTTSGAFLLGGKLKKS